MSEQLARELMPGAWDEDEFDDAPMDYGNEVTESSDALENTDISDEVAADDDALAAASEAPVEEAEAEPAEADAADTAEAEEPLDVQSDVPESDEARVEDEPAPKKIMIPKARLDDEVAKRRKLESELAELKSAREKAETDAAADEAFNAAIAEANKLMREANAKVLDGELDAATELQQQALVKMATARATPKTSEGANPAQMAEQIEARIELKATLKDIYRRYPQMDSNAEDADIELIDRAVMYEEMYVNQGHSPAMAVERAVEDAVRLIRPELMQTQAPVQKPVKASPEAKRTQEKRSDLESKVAMAQKQPPKAPASSISEPMVDVNSLSEEEFDALPASTRAKLRGDYV